ncbi:Bug family tripartite tricarboxylate transporter substrate binding protein [Thauera sinica]|uniref:Bug family tripartite tricarboxylate transporter substrate binding protein n=1 Tax=Thauera sinica TaxID=2665146 RepID=A0ABW1AVG0_9RHOO|nr:tripartite tricarboxylate transporter substrate binding protein [Thauera sp. K11]ATE61167.1 TctC [Thauera sp. K11]
MSRISESRSSNPFRALCGLALASALAGTAAQAADFPSRPVTIYTVSAPGSGPDVLLRFMGGKLEKSWKQKVRVENRPGGAGFLAIGAARREAADGHALLELECEHLTALQHLYPKRNFNALTVFDPVTALLKTPFMLAVSSKSPWTSVNDLISASARTPDEITYGSWGVGSAGHLGGELLELSAGVKTAHLPFQDVGQLYNAVAKGHVSWSFASIPSSLEAYREGGIRYLAVAAPRRIDLFPNVPTIAEAGGPAGVTVESCAVIVAPRGVPGAVRERIHRDVQQVLAEPEVREKLRGFAYEPLTWSAEEIRRNAEQRSREYESLIRRANIRLD